MRHDARVTQTRERAATPPTPIPLDEAVAGGRRRFRTLDSFRIISFRWFFTSMFAGFAAMGVQMFAAGWLTFELTGSFAALGLLHLAAGITGLLTALPGGVLADKVKHRKRFIQIGQAGGAIGSLAMGLLVASGNVQFWQIAVGASLIAGSHTLTMPARQALTPSVVGMKHLTNAMALYTTGQNGAFLLMPALAGWMIGALGPEGSIAGTQYLYYLMAALYVAALVLLLPVEIGPRAAAAPSRALGQLADGLRYVARDPVMRPLLIYNGAVALFWMTYMTLLPGYAKEVLGVGAGALGLLLSMGGLGAVGGSLVVASIPGGQRGRVWMLSVALIGIAMLVFSLNTVFWIALVCAVGIGIGQAGYLSLGSVLLQAYTDEDYRGRALSVYMMQYGLMSLGTLLVSLVANAIGPQIAVGLASLALLAITAAQFIARTPISRLR